MRNNQYAHLTPSDIDEFWKQFPSAAEWLSDRDQQRELEALRVELAGEGLTPDRLREVEKRILELQWRYSTKETGDTPSNDTPTIP